MQRSGDIGEWGIKFSPPKTVNLIDLFMLILHETTLLQSLGYYLWNTSKWDSQLHISLKKKKKSVSIYFIYLKNRFGGALQLLAIA